MLLIKNAYVKTMVGPDLENGQVLIDGGKILEVGADIDLKGETPQVFDAVGCIVSPGFVDAHCHIGLLEEGIGPEGQDVNERSDPITPHVRGLDAINPRDIAFKEALAAGVTTAVAGPGSADVIGGTFCAFKLHGVRIDDMVIKDPVAMKVALGENPKKCFGNFGKAPYTRMGEVALLRETLFKAREYLEAKERAESPDKLPKFDMKLEALIPVLKKEIPIKAHCHRADDIFSALRVAKEFDLDITLDHCTEGYLVADILAKEGKPALLGPFLMGRSKPELSNKCYEAAGILCRAGVKICITSDSNATPLDLLPVTVGKAIQAGLEEQEGWKAITIHPAQVAGIADRVGSLEKGKDADIAIFRGNPLTDLGYVTVATFVNGECVHKEADCEL